MKKIALLIIVILLFSSIVLSKDPPTPFDSFLSNLSEINVHEGLLVKNEGPLLRNIINTRGSNNCNT